MPSDRNPMERSSTEKKSSEERSTESSTGRIWRRLDSTEQDSEKLSQSQAWTDQRIESLLGTLLRSGVLCAALVVAVGGIIYLFRHGRTPVDFRVFRGEPADLRSIHGVLRDVKTLHGRGIIQLGLLLLIATPVARVAFSIFGFAVERDRMYVLFTVIVFCVLLYSLLGSA